MERDKLTEREQKLLDYTLFLVSELNVYVTLVGCLYKNLRQLEKLLEYIPDREKREHEFVSFLASEYKINLEVIPDAEIVHKRIIDEDKK